jgi:hypothetical protein
MALRAIFTALALPIIAGCLSLGCSSQPQDDQDEEEGALESDGDLQTFVGEAAGPQMLGSDFVRLEAHEKQKRIWDAVTAPSEIRCRLRDVLQTGGDALVDAMLACDRAGTMPHSTIANSAVDGAEALARRVFLSAGLLKPAFDNGGDEMEPGRKKLLHPYGAVAKVEFRRVAEDTGYTGLFSGGSITANPGIARISSGGAESVLGGFVPGMGLKFFVQGAASIDLHVMHGMNAQNVDTEGRNPFARPFSNEFQKEGATLFIKAGMKLFDLVHNPSNMLPLDQTAYRDWNGASAQAPVAPRKVVFEPTPEVKATADAFVRAHRGVDHRVVLAVVTKSAGEGEKGIPLYTVRNDQGGVLGTLVATSPFVPSRFGDRQLFFRHHHGCDRKDGPPACGGSRPQIQ